MSFILLSRRLLSSRILSTRVLPNHTISRTDFHCGFVIPRHVDWSTYRSSRAVIGPRDSRRSFSDSGRPGHQESENRQWGSTILTLVAIPTFVGFAFWIRWYTTRGPDYGKLSEEGRDQTRRHVSLERSAEDTPHLHSTTTSTLSASNTSSIPPVVEKATGPDDNRSPQTVPESGSGEHAPSTSSDEPKSTPASSSSEPEGPQINYIDPAKVEFPGHVPYLIVGAGAAGLSAARAIRASHAQSKVLMIAGGSAPEFGSEPGISETDFQEPPPYLRPPLSKELWRRSKAREQKVLQTTGDIRRHSWLYYEPECFFLKPEYLPAVEFGGIALLRGDPVVRLDADSHKAILASGRIITYDRCLLATGGSPKRLEHLEVCATTQRDLRKAGLVSYFRTLADYRRLREWVDKHRKTGSKVAVIGGGFLGSELTVSLLTEPTPDDKINDKGNEATTKSGSASKNNLSLLHIFRESSPMGRILPPCLASATGRFEAGRGAELWPSSEVVSISVVPEPLPLPSPVTVNVRKDEKIPFATLQTVAASEVLPQRVRLRIRRNAIGGGKVEEVEVDHVIIAAGIEPNTQLADSAGLEVDPVNGGFLVNAEFEARAGIFAAGDAASYWDPVLGFRRRVEHLNFAEETGALAGKNMARIAPKEPTAASDSHYEPIRYQYQSSLWSSLGPDLSWDAIGHVDSRRLLTRAFFVSDDMMSSKETKANGTTNANQSIPSAEFGRLGHGVVFYLTPEEKRLVGILLWNLPEDLYKDQEYTAPSRLNLARGLLAKRMCIGNSPNETEDDELRRLSSYFDLVGELEEDYNELKAYAEAKKQELLSSAVQEDKPVQAPASSSEQ
ncbi:Apoptosis-inducing factor 1, mitochondrial [Clonorchis sinensis]|uniref:Apoptosis-inducing factor 1, mitochondrial n=1 Tax=Clonorchis sinensis TaxID=79923 RepID=A0A8T1M4M6_CLOSI|nr:Apoptosis-inducing factor 1, mitochondrial [Clonorchis sinensis]